MIKIDLTGKVILVTGAMGAIAEHMVKRLNAAGAVLIVVDLKPANEAHELLASWKIPDESFIYHSLDLTDSAKLTQVVNTSFERFPNMDTVLGHAGGCVPASFCFDFGVELRAHFPV